MSTLKADDPTIPAALSGVSDYAAARADKHVITIDAARGVFAFSVLFYHELYFNGIVQIERIAYYAVYGFFVISGFALFVAYHDKIGTADQIRTFFVRRFFRIAPLYFSVLALRLLVQRWPGEMTYRMVLNLTLTFGLANAGSTALPGGGWSIGIEMVFYTLFPIIMILAGRSLLALAAMTVVSVYLMHKFINITLAGPYTEMNADNWERYVQPIAFFGYFAFGMLLAAVYLRFQHLKGNAVLAVTLIVVGLIPFLTIRTNTTLQLLTGTKGLILMTATMVIVAGAAFLPEPRGLVRRAAIWLGVMSYPHLPRASRSRPNCQ